MSRRIQHCSSATAKSFFQGQMQEVQQWQFQQHYNGEYTNNIVDHGCAHFSNPKCKAAFGFAYPTWIGCINQPEKTLQSPFQLAWTNHNLDSGKTN